MRGVRVTLLPIFVLLAACGGGGGNSGPSPQPPPPPPVTVTVEGAAHKGPFSAGADVSVSSLLANGNIGARLADTTITDDLGRYSTVLNADQLVEIEVNGTFMNELDGAPSLLPTRLRLVTRISSVASQTANVNVLTHLAASRFRALLAAGGLTAEEARGQALNDVLNALTPIAAPPAIDSFKALSLYSESQDDPGSAYLVTISSVFIARARQLALQNGSVVADELQIVLDTMAEDLSDGEITDTVSFDNVRAASSSVDPHRVAASLADLASTAGSTDYAGNIQMFLDTDLDGIANAADDDDDGDGVEDVGDAYPEDLACYLAEDGDGTACDIESTLPASFTPDVVDADDQGIVYLLSSADNRIFRWSIDDQRYLFSLRIPAGATSMVFSRSHDRLYVGFASGRVISINPVGRHDQSDFATLATAVGGLADAGNFLLVQDASGAWASHHTYDAGGTLRTSVEWNYYSRVYAWNPALNRVYFFRDNTSPNDLHYEDIDQNSGQIIARGQTPYHGDYLIAPPIRVSGSGDRVLLGSGDVYDAGDLTWLGAIPSAFTDARWLSDDGIVVVRDESGNALVERRDAAGTVVEAVQFSGVPLAIVPSGADHVVITNQGRPEFHVYVASDDSDGDGVLNTADDFPLDPAASVDSDGDGYPDAWNAGQTAADSTTGLTLDGYPNDSACYLPGHGDGMTCNVTATMPDYVPASIEIDGAGVVYLFSPENGRIFRWDSVTEEHLNPIIIGSDRWLADSTPTVMAYHSAHFRIYVGYDNGDIHYIDLAAGLEKRRLTTLATAVDGLADAGNFLLAQDASGAWASHHIYDAGGTRRTSVEWNYYSRVYDWNPVLNRVYFFRDDTSPNDLHYEDIDQVSGEITAAGDSPYHSDYLIAPPIRVSAVGDRVLLGSGDVYDAGDLTWLGAIPSAFTDAQWLSDDGIVLVRDESGNALVERRDAAGTVVEVVQFSGVPLAIVPSGADHVVVTDEGRPTFHVYIASDDSDGDGVLNTADDFPLDPAASVDSDGDGYPDAWNAGRTEADSTTGLTLDGYPTDSACYLPGHGDGVTCDITATIPDYVPASIEIDGAGMVYLFSPENGRVFRWDSVTEEHLNPIIIGSDRWLADSTPTVIAYHSAHFRLYLGYDNGDINYIDLAAGLEERRLTTLATAVGGLADVGSFLLAQDASGARASHHIYDAGGTRRTSADTNYYSRVYDWNPVLNRVYFFRDGLSPNDLHYEDINQTDGQIIARGETPYFDEYLIAPPIRVSAGGDRVLLGSGDVYDAGDLTWLGAIPSAFTDAQWLSDDGIVVVRDESGNALVERRDAAGTVVEVVQFIGAPLAIVPSAENQLVVTDQGRPAFHVYVASDDSDGDGVLNTADDFPLDPAASVDSDGDGYPDAWNAGRTEADSTTGLTLDSYPSDSACYLPGHGDGVTCDVTATMPDYVPASIEIDGAGVVYSFSPENRRIFRWDSVTGEHLDPIVVGSDRWLESSMPTVMAYHSAHFRLYLGYENGDINYIDLAAVLEEQRLTTLTLAVGGLADAGNFLLAQDASGAWASHHIYDADGTRRTSVEWNYYSRAYAWSPVLNRVYFFRDDTSPNDLHYEDIDQTSGQIIARGETPYHGDYLIAPPIRVSAGGDRVLLGSGDVYDAGDLTWLGAVSGTFTDAQWLSDDGIVLVRDESGNALVERRDAAGTVVEVVQFSGVPLAIVPFGADHVVVTDEGRPTYHVYVASDDSDGDGVQNTADDFPLDPAASVDSDGDGYPDAWNAGQTAADSTTGLTLDSYPNDSACYLPGHGDGVTCDVTATIPDYVPASIEIDGAGVVYLFSPESGRIFRWDSVTEEHLNPIIIGSDRWLADSTPTVMAYHSAHFRIYVGYDNGDINYIDLAAELEEQRLTTLALAVGGLADAGNFLLAQDASGAWASHHIYDAGGTRRTSVEWNYYSRVYDWNPVLNRVYFFRDDTSPNDLHYEDIDQVSGEITAAGDSPYHGEYPITPPIRVSVDGSRVLIGGGGIYDADSLGLITNIPGGVTDTDWLNDGRIVTLRQNGGETLFEVFDASYVSESSMVIPNAPLASRRYGNDIVVVTLSARPEFVVITP